MLHLDAIKKWGAEAGNTIVKAKTVSPKVVEAEKAEVDELQTFK